MLRRARRAAAAEPILAKSPATSMAPSGCTAMQVTWPSGFGVKLPSAVPLLLNRTRNWGAPPTRILPSACAARASTAPPAGVELKPVKTPSRNLARDGAGWVKLPPTMIRCASCSKMASTSPSSALKPGELSKLPPGVILAK